MRTRTERRRHAGFSRMPGSGKPFKRAIALHKQFIDALAATAQALPIDRQIALSALPPYVSRGHGGKHRPTQRLVGSRQFEDRSRYSPAEKKRPFHRAPDMSCQAGLAFAEAIVAKAKHDPRAV